jgi:hypothetical protein
MSLLSKIKKVARKGTTIVNKIAKSPIVKVGIAGACIVCPAVGAPLAAGVALSAKISDSVRKGTPKQKAAAKKLLTATAVEAKKGNPDAVRMLKLVATHNKAAAGDPKAKKAVATVAKVAVATLAKSQQADAKGIGTFQLMASGRIRKVS